MHKEPGLAPGSFVLPPSLRSESVARDHVGLSSLGFQKGGVDSGYLQAQYLLLLGLKFFFSEDAIGSERG